MTPDNRIKRLENLLSNLKDKGYKTYASIEEEFDVNASYISQLLNKRRNFGEAAARKMEEKFNLPTFYFEQPTDSEADLAVILEKGSVVGKSPINTVTVPIYAVYFCCGDGNGECEFEEIKGERILPESLFSEKNVKPENFKLVCAVNESMKPYINHGDEVGIDIGDRDVKDGEVYAILLDGDRMFKQIFREAGGALRLHSFNPDYPDKIVTEDNHDSLIIVGRQIYRAG